MGSNGIPREIYIFTIIIIYGIFGFLYIAFGNTMYKINPDYEVPNLIQSDYTNNLLNEDTNSFAQTMLKGVVGSPAWLNWFMGILTALAVTMIIIMVLHG